MFAAALSSLLVLAGAVSAQPGAADVVTAATAPDSIDITQYLPAHVEFRDLPNDNGTGLVLTWDAPDQKTTPDAVRYRITIGTSPNGPFYLVTDVRATRDPHASTDPAVFGWDPHNADLLYAIVQGYTMPPDAADTTFHRASIVPDRRYYARFSVTDGIHTATLANTLTAVPRQSLFDWNKLNSVVFVILFSAVILWYIERARRDPNLYIRKIAGLDAVEEAVGRATEMGKPVYFVHGLDGMDSISTIAAMNLLGPIARRTFEYETDLKVLNNDPIVLAVSKETVHQASMDVGRPDSYNEDNVMFLADRQFSYAAATNGLLVRERPATVLLFGYFYAEALLFTETGGQIGAIQVAGTDSYTQLPFFITTCDYTLMGEELYAASAYLSREPKLLGSLRGQDIGKAVLMAALVIGSILEIFGISWLAHLVAPL